MISTTELTGVQLEQLEALLADTTPGGGLYRPPVARDVEVLRELEAAKLAHFTADCGYELTDTGRGLVVGRAKDIADSHAFVMYSPDEDLRDAIAALKLEAARYTDTDGNHELREQVLADIEACQDELDRRAENPSPVVWDDADLLIGTGRHHLVEADDRPTAAIPPVQEQTAPMPRTGTLDLPVVSPDDAATDRFIAAIKGTGTADEVFDELARDQAAERAALEAELGDERSWLARNLTPRRKFVLTIVATVVLTWAAAWLVIG